MALNINQYAKQDTIVVDLDRSSDKILYSVNQGEQDARLLWIALKQYGKTYTMPSGVTAYLSFLKPDGTYAFSQLMINGNASDVYYNHIAMPITAQMCQAAGDCTVQITLVKTVVNTLGSPVETALATCIFKIRVNNSALGDIISSTEFELFYEGLSKADEVVSRAENAINDINNTKSKIEKMVDDGEFTATVDIGNVNVVDSNSAGVTNTSPDAQHAVFDINLPAVTFEFGTISRGEAGTMPIVTNSGSPHAVVIDMTIPKGDKGDRGDDGVVVSLSNGQFMFDIGDDGNLYVLYNDGSTPPNLHIDEDGELIYTF